MPRGGRGTGRSKASAAVGTAPRLWERWSSSVSHLGAQCKNGEPLDTGKRGGNTKGSMPCTMVAYIGVTLCVEKGNNAIKTLTSVSRRR